MTETDFINRSHELESSLLSGQIQEYCELKIVNSTDVHEKTLWQFLKVRRVNSISDLRYLDFLFVEYLLNFIGFIYRL